MTTETPQPSANDLSAWFASSRTLSGRVLLLIGAIFAGLCAYFSWLAGAWNRGEATLPNNMPMLVTAFWALWTALSFLGVGVWQLGAEPPPERRALTGRAASLLLSALIGSGVFFLGLALLYSWSDVLTKLLREGEREGAWRILLAVVLAIGGLAIMFAGLQSARADERRVIGIRRYVYGFNAFLTGFLLLGVLVVLNVLVYLRLPATIDATGSGAHTISDRTKQVLSELDQPATLYLVMPHNDVYDEVKNLVDRFAEQNSRLTINNVSLRDKTFLQQLVKKYPRLAEEGEGILITMGDDTNKSSYIPQRDLVSRDGNPMSGTPPVEKFQGESKIITELSFLMAGKEKPIIYFTQGNGEPDLSDTRKKEGLGILKERLVRRNFDVRPLKIESINPTIPEDAKVIVVAGPTRTYAQPAADALKAYCDKGGKLLVMADVVEVGRGVKEMPATGLEGLMADYGVEITKERICTLIILGGGRVGANDTVAAMANPAVVNNPIIAPFKNAQFQFSSCRVIRPIADQKNPSLHVQTLLESLLDDQMRYWTETDMSADLEQTVNQILRDREAQKRLVTKPLPLMIAVSETERGLPGAPPGPEKPKLIVFGDSTFVANLSASDREAIEFDLFIGSLEWLRERPNSIGIEPRTYKYYEMERWVSPIVDRLRFMPLLFGTILVFGLGIGVWLIRRQ